MKISVTGVIFMIIDCVEFREYVSISGKRSIVVVKADNSKMPVILRIPEKVSGLPVTRISNFAFLGCTNLIHLTIPDSVEVIGDCAFEGCCGLKFVDMYCSSCPAQSLLIEQRAFAGCTNLYSFRAIVNVVACTEAFAVCSKLECLNFRFDALGEDVFWGCDKLEKIDFANSAYWEIETFQNCKKLNNVVFWGDIDSCVTEGALDEIKEKKIKCTDMFPFLDWAYDGVDLEIFNE